MTEQLPDPLVPAEVDLRDFSWMPVEIHRLRRSKAWLICKRRPELAFYMLNLWTAAWHDTPAGSLEDDDDVLADLAMCPPDKWPKVREHAMRGWVKCSDGRLYHAVVAAQAMGAWEQKQAQRQRTEAARMAREQKRQQQQSQAARDATTENVTKPATGSVTELPLNPTEQTGPDRTGEGPDRTGDSVSGGGKPRPARKAPPDFVVTLPMRHWASTNAPRVQLDRETEKFRDHTFRTAITDWPGAWRNWMRKAEDDLPKGRQPQQSTEQRNAEAMSLLGFGGPNA